MLRTTILIASIALGVTSTASASDYRTASVDKTVTTYGVNFSDRQDVAEFHARLKRVAADVCNSDLAPHTRYVMSDRECARQVLDQAIAKVGRSELYAFHTGSQPNMKVARVAD